MRQELVQRRIEQADRDRQAAHDREQLDEVLALHRQQLGQRRAAARLVVGEDHLAHRDDAVALEEHVLGAAQADAFRAEIARGLGVERRLGVGAHLHAAHLVGPAHQRGELARQLRLAASSPRPAAPGRCEPSMVMTSPFFSVCPATVSVCAA